MPVQTTSPWPTASELRANRAREDHLLTPSRPRERVAIGYAVPSAGAVVLRIYDALGRLVLGDRQEHLAPGRYAFMEEIRGLVPGAYGYVIMTAGRYVRGTLILSR